MVDPIGADGISDNAADEDVTWNSTNNEGITEKEYKDMIKAHYEDVLELDDQDTNACIATEIKHHCEVFGFGIADSPQHLN